MKLFKKLFLPILFIFFSCDDASNTISNSPGEINAMYQFNLTFSEEIENSDTITLFWDEDEDIYTFNIEIDGIIISPTEPNNYTFSLLPGFFKDVIINADDKLSESIKVFSSPMAPSTWEPDFAGDIKVSEPSGGGENQFTWIPSTESDIETVKLKKCGYINSPIECSELSNFFLVESFDSVNSTFSENKNFGEKACYIMNSTDDDGNSRYSQTICNDLTANAMLDVTITSISNNLDYRINLEWDEYIEADFYQYTIYRSKNEEMDEASRIVLAEIIDATQTVFEDRNDIGIGKTWYYQIEVHNQFGRIKKSSIISGKSKP